MILGIMVCVVHDDYYKNDLFIFLPISKNNILLSRIAIGHFRLLVLKIEARKKVMRWKPLVNLFL